MKALSRIGPGPLLFLAIWLFFMVAGQTRLLRDPGTQWHTVVGERILKQGFTTDEPFSFSRADARWIPHQWLGEVGMALAYRIGGFDTFVLMTATALAALFTWLTLRLLRTGFNPAVGTMIAVVMIAVATSHLHVRPMLVTLFALAITVAMLSDYESAKLKLKSLFWLVSLYLLWSNIHGGMLGGLVSMALVLAGWIVFKIVKWPNPLNSWQDVLWFILLCLLCGLTAFINPYGLGIPRVWMTILNQPLIAELIEEHQPLDLTQPASWALVVLALFYLFTLLGTLNRKPQVTWFLPLFWLLQSFQHVRHSPLFAVTAFVATTAMWPHTRWATWLATKRPDVFDPSKPVSPSPLGAWLLPTGVVLLSMILQATGTRVPVIGTGWAHLDANLWPVDLLDDLERHELRDGRRNRIFNDCGYGGFLIFHTPGYKVFVDDRAELYGEDFLVDFVNAGDVETATALNRWQKQYGDFDFALVKNDANFDAVFAASSQWKLIRRGQVASFYVSLKR